MNEWSIAREKTSNLLTSNILTCSFNKPTIESSILISTLSGIGIVLAELILNHSDILIPLCIPTIHQSSIATDMLSRSALAASVV